MKLRLAPAAIRDLERLRQFLEDAHPASAAGAAGRIIQAIENVIEFPGIGRNLPRSDTREVFVRFGRSGYIIRYAVDAPAGEITVIRVWHGREEKD